MDKIIELAKKLKALSDRGVGGEKLNASKKLEQIMKRHGLTIEDIEGERKNYTYFKVAEIQHQLFIQITSSVLGIGFELMKDRRKRGQFVLLLTAFEAVEIQMKYDFYWKLYKDELDIFTSAFIAKNDIYHPNGNKVNPNELSKDEIARLKRIIEMSDSIKRGELRKSLC